MRLACWRRSQPLSAASSKTFYAQERDAGKSGLLSLRFNQSLRTYLRARKPGPKPPVGCDSGYQRMVRAMTHKKNSALIASLSAVALMLANSGASARNGGMIAPHAFGHRPFVHVFRHHGPFGPVAWPADNGADSAYGQAPADITPPVSNDVHYTYTYDVPWDWAHRLPPRVTRSDRPYVPSCSNEGVTVPGNNGEEHTVNVTRCY